MKSFLCLLSFFIIGKSAVSQAFTIENVQSLYDQYNFEKSRANALDADRYSMISGSPFLSEEFIMDEVVINDSIRYEKIPLRYNIFTDKMEFLDNQERVLEVNTALHSFSFHFGDYHFVLVSYKDGNLVRKGLLEMVVDGRIRLYRKYLINISAGMPPRGYQAATPDRFVRKNDQYFLATNDKMPLLVLRRRDLINQLKAVNPDIRQYLKSNRLNMRSEQSLIDILEYTNSQINQD